MPVTRRGDDVGELLENLERMAGDMTRWESGFVESLRDRLDAGQALTERQLEMLERVYARRLGR